MLRKIIILIIPTLLFTFLFTPNSVNFTQSTDGIYFTPKDSNMFEFSLSFTKTELIHFDSVNYEKIINHILINIGVFFFTYFLIRVIRKNKTLNVSRKASSIFNIVLTFFTTSFILGILLYYSGLFNYCYGSGSSCYYSSNLHYFINTVLYGDYFPGFLGIVPTLAIALVVSNIFLYQKPKSKKSENKKIISVFLTHIFIVGALIIGLYIQNTQGYSNNQNQTEQYPYIPYVTI